MKNKVANVLFLIVLLISANLSAGKLSGELTDKISKISNNEFVSVWIKLPEVQSSTELKRIAKALPVDRAVRYKATADKLELNHLSAQHELLSALDLLKKQDNVKSYNSHWLVNIVEAEIRINALRSLLKRDDIEIIYSVPKITSVGIKNKRKKLSNFTDAISSTVGTNLRAIKADSAWKAGFTGAGRIVCSIDGGVDASHPALVNSWKGRDGDSSAAWFDPAYKLNYPHGIPTGNTPFHGTRTTGIIVGRDDLTGDTIGVAINAQWIAAGVLNIPGASLIDGLEWAANPDGDFNTISDLPDVINHSWGVSGIDCQDIFYSLMDNIEALGIVNIFAAGNSGAGGTNIVNPANRALDSIDCFAVGAVDSFSVPQVASISSRGPSDCNGAIKPNVTAPGKYVITTELGGGYVELDGTSFAAPHVSGLVALLREKNPNATVDEIKTAILTSTQTYGLSLPDNNYGWGVIDCMGALNALSVDNSLPNVVVHSFDYQPLNSGNTAIGTIKLLNRGATASNISLTVTASDPLLNVLNGTAFYGVIGEGDTLRSGDSLRIAIDPSARNGSVLTADIMISDGGSYSNSARLYIQVGNKRERSFATHNVNNIEFSISNFGTFGMADGGEFPAGGVGFKFNSGFNDLYEGGLMIGIGPTQVSDGVRNPVGEPDGDFAVSNGGNISLLQPGITSDQDSYSIFDDSRAENPIGLKVEQNSYAFANSPNDNYIILVYDVTNVNSFSVNSIFVGIYLDWDIVTYNSNAGGYDSSGAFLWTAYNNGVDLRNYRGIKLLGGSPRAALTQTIVEVDYPTDGDGFTESEKYLALYTGFSTANLYKNVYDDLNQVLSSGPIDLLPDESQSIAFALLAGTDSAEIFSAALFAQTAYDKGISVGIDDEVEKDLPEQFTLSQNYPNPFNPETKIEFSLPRSSVTKLEIFNVNGQKVRILISGILSAGNHVVSWDGKDNNSKQLPSGIYIYRLVTNQNSSSNKMMLLK